MKQQVMGFMSEVNAKLSPDMREKCKEYCDANAKLDQAKVRFANAEHLLNVQLQSEQKTGVLYFDNAARNIVDLHFKIDKSKIVAEVK